MEREQIIKALECCKTPLASDCENCVYTGKRLEDGVYEGCVNCLVGDALSLIKELIEEKYDIECSYKLLKKDNDRLHETCTEFERKCASLTEENERLRDELAKRPPKLVITKLPEKGCKNV